MVTYELPNCICLWEPHCLPDSLNSFAAKWPKEKLFSMARREIFASLLPEGWSKMPANCSRTADSRNFLIELHPCSTGESLIRRHVYLFPMHASWRLSLMAYFWWCEPVQPRQL